MARQRLTDPRDTGPTNSSGVGKRLNKDLTDQTAVQAMRMKQTKDSANQDNQSIKNVVKKETATVAAPQPV